MTRRTGKQTGMGGHEGGLTLEALARRLEALEVENERVRSENAALREEVAAIRGSEAKHTSAPTVETPGLEERMSRRRLLGQGRGGGRSQQLER